jgi:hypothetical protein
MHKKTFMLTALCVAIVATPALGQTWNAETLLLKDRSPAGCTATVAKLTFTVDASTLKVAGTLLDIKVPINADGTVKQDVRLAKGSRGSLSGKIATRAFEYTSYTTGCQYNWAEVN